MADYDTIQKRRNIVVGVFVVVALGALGWLVFKFRDLPTGFSKLTSYYVNVQFASAPGVQDGTPVRLGGYQVGRVINIMAPIIREDRKTGMRYLQTLLILAIDKRYITIPSNADVKLMKRGLGSSYIEIYIDPIRPLEPTDPNHPETVYMQEGMTLQGSIGMVSEFFPEESQQKLDELVGSLTALIRNTNDIVGDKQNRENLKATLANLNVVTTQAEQTLKEIQEFSAISKDAVRNTDKRLTEVTTVVVESGGQLNAAIGELRIALEKLNSGEGTAAKLLTDDRLYESLLESTEELRVALQQFKEVMEKTNKKGGIKLSIF